MTKPPIFPAGKLKSLMPRKFEDESFFEEVCLEGFNLGGSKVDDMTLETVRMKRAEIEGSIFGSARWTDVSVEQSNLANISLEDAAILRTEFAGCRLTGLQVNGAGLEDVAFRNCRMDLSLFRFSRMKNVLFENCNLGESDFTGASLAGVSFIGCDLGSAEFSHAKLDRVDFSRSDIESMRINPDQIRGIIIDHTQIYRIVELMGITVT